MIQWTHGGRDKTGSDPTITLCFAKPYCDGGDGGVGLGFGVGLGLGVPLVPIITPQFDLKLIRLVSSVLLVQAFHFERIRNSIETLHLDNLTV